MPEARDFWREPVRRRKGTPCPKLVWVLIYQANLKREPLELSYGSGEWTRKRLRTIARSPTPFKFTNPDLKETLERLGLEWLTPTQVSRIRECAAPRRMMPRHYLDREFGWAGVDPRHPKPSPKCKRLFWAWRREQKTCDGHRWAASMLRVEKHRKGKSDSLRNARQLKDARQQLKRVRRSNKRIQRLERDSQRPPITPAQLQAQNDKADFRLLRFVNLGMVEKPTDTDSERLDRMVEEGYVRTSASESEPYRLSGSGKKLLGELRKRIGAII